SSAQEREQIACVIELCRADPAGELGEVRRAEWIWVLCSEADRVLRNHARKTERLEMNVAEVAAKANQVVTVNPRCVVHQLMNLAVTTTGQRVLDRVSQVKRKRKSRIPFILDCVADKE